MALEVFNTLAGKKEEFKPAADGKVGMYSCGITPYDASHLGHARCYLTWDVVKRYLRYSGFAVKHVQNFTDVDDKIINRAKETGEKPEKLAERYMKQYFHEFDALNVERADDYPKVTEHIQDIIKVIGLLVGRGFAYESGGDVFFEVGKFGDYGKLSKQNVEDLIKGKRVEVNENKRHPADFALWKAAKPGEPSWDSPWGRGRPGWHIECSAMSMKYLGPAFDLHCGGQDLVFPHHENEIAQSEAASGKKPFAKYWMHNGFVTVGKEKMAKSLGNFLTVAQALEKYEPNAIRFFMLSTQYRQPIDFSENALQQATESVKKLEEGIDRLEKTCGKQKPVEKMDDDLLVLLRRFTDAMDDDFNTPAAISASFEIRGYAFRQLQDWEEKGDGKALEKCWQALALLKKLMFDVFGFKKIRGKKTAAITEKQIEEKIVERNKARKAGDYAKADAIRKELAGKGIILEDRKDGTTGWRAAG